MSGLKLFNSFTRDKELFAPKNGNQVLWYSCGPTVYDASHMGHARSYISFDIIRRVMTDYFGYNILYVMNITDIDDKIIKRARKNFLYDQYLTQKKPSSEILSDIKKASELHVQRLNNCNDEDEKKMLQSSHDTLQSLLPSFEKLTIGDNATTETNLTNMLESSKDILSEYLDLKLGGTVTDHSIFTELPRFWEEEFYKDMNALNVKRPDVLTRVSEYVPEIVTYIERIIENGMAYESEGSVYFDVIKFDDDPRHSYATLLKEAFDRNKTLDTGESSAAGKKSQLDFALWKASKTGEPAWDSPWGKGRPGWHIECSVMASAICGDHLDIHTGGVDLKFPHHTNEIAQAEAYFGNSHWVKYFLHSGHLTIAGCKMSKSLKNFVTIKDALKRYTSRQLRFAFLLHSWRDTLDYSDNTMEHAVNYEKSLNEFFLSVKDIIYSKKPLGDVGNLSKWTSEELRLNSTYMSTKDDVHAALCDNIDTRTTLMKLKDLITACNTYMKSPSVNTVLLSNVALYITNIIKIFGAAPDSEAIGFPTSADSSSVDRETTLRPCLEILGDFRAKVKDLSKDIKASEILRACDDLRDNILPSIGVRLEDKEGSNYAIKLVDAATLLAEREAKKAQEAAKELEKAKRASQAAEKEAMKKLPPSELFLKSTDKYSRFDEKGIPTHDAEGKEISKGQLKKLQKLYQAQATKYEEYLASLKSQ